MQRQVRIDLLLHAKQFRESTLSFSEAVALVKFVILSEVRPIGRTQSKDLLLATRYERCQRDEGLLYKRLELHFFMEI